MPLPRVAHAAGFTLIELMIVVAILAIIASIAIPNLISARLRANESAAIATLRGLGSTQAQMRTMAAIDANRNGAGEYGFFGELAGTVAPRIDEAGAIGGSPVVPLMMPAFGNLTNGRVLRSGYVFSIYLPGAGTGAPTAEAATGGALGIAIDALMAESVWCAYAWPGAYGQSGNRAFFTNQVGDVLWAGNSTTRYDGDVRPLPGDAAYLAGAPNIMTSPAAANTVGNDGQRWVVLQ
jgi:prepilin-type N-terminal cleavage/methylation domain-containing protein